MGSGASVDVDVDVEVVCKGKGAGGGDVSRLDEPFSDPVTEVPPPPAPERPPLNEGGGVGRLLLLPNE